MGAFDDLIPAGGGVAIATTFADPADVRRYRAAIAAGATEQQALAVGDNGVGAWGDDTTNPNDPIVALPRDTPGIAHNRLVQVTGPSGTVMARVADKMPATRNIRNGAAIDLNPATALATGATSGKETVSWQFADSPSGKIDRGAFDDLIPRRESPAARNEFADLIPKPRSSVAASPEDNLFADLIPKGDVAPPAITTPPQLNADRTGLRTPSPQWLQPIEKAVVDATFPQSEDAYGTPGVTKPLYQPDRLVGGQQIPILNPQGAPTGETRTIGNFEAGATNVIRGFIAGATSLKGLIGFLPPVFAANLIHSAPELVQQVQDAQKTAAGSQERVEAGLNIVATLVTAGLLGKGMVESLRPHISEAAESTPTRLNAASDPVVEPSASALSVPGIETPPTPDATPPTIPAVEPGTIPFEALQPDPTASAAQNLAAEYAALSARLDELNKDQFLPAPQSAPIFQQDDSIPFMTKVRMEDAAKASGVSEEQLAQMTTPEVSAIVERARAQTISVVEGGGSPEASKEVPATQAGSRTDSPLNGPQIPESGVSQIGADKGAAENLSSEQQMEAAYQADLLNEAKAYQASGGEELLTAIANAGGLPSRGSAEHGEFHGEIDNLHETARNPARTERLSLNKLFREDAPNIDDLATSLRDQGFDVQTPNDVFNLVETRLRTGKEIYGAPGQPEPQLFASGTAAPKAKPQTFKSLASIPSSAASPHAPPPFPRVPGPAPASPAIAKAVQPVRTWWQARTLGIRKLVAPQTIDLQARKVANIVRDYNGQLANRIAQADHALAAARADFDRTPVPKNWSYDPNRPLPRNYAFMAESERGGAGLSVADQQLKSQLDKMFAEAVDEVHRVKPAALKSLIQDYFPHIWQDPEAAQRAFASMIGTRPLEGSKTFLKKRALAYIEDGLKLGLKPISDNPIDMVLTKLHEVHKFVAAQDILTEAKAIGARKFVYIFEKPPEGWVKIDDPTSTVHAPPFVTVPEAFDEQMKVKTIELLDQLGIKHERAAKLGGKRWGTFETGGGGIRTKFAGPLSVYWHELGHGLQERYNWLDTVLRGEKAGGQSPVAQELRALADLRASGSPSKSFKSYVRSADEKAAVMLEAYMHAPQRMQQVAPLVFGRVKKFIATHPELQPIEEIRPSLVLGTSKVRIDVGGMVTLGHYYMPEGAAAVLANYVSPGLQRSGVIRSIRNSTNILSGMQLGFSAFHAGFTSIDAAVSQFARGLQLASEGKVIEAGKRVVATPFAPVMNYYTGKAVQTAMLDPNWSGKVKLLGRTRQLSPHGEAVVNEIAQLAVKAGLRATVDPFWRTQVTRNMMRAWHQGGVKGFAGTILRAPFAASEQMMRPILEYLVPRQKLGVFAGIARDGMNRLGPNADLHQVRDMLAQAADSTEDRMGMMTYDNLFYNRMVRDAALLGFRSYGWTFGKYRALFGGIGDALSTVGRMKEGGPLLTPRMAYLLALPMVTAGLGSFMNYVMTGEPPKDWKDALMPRTGKLDRNGNPERLSLPTYIKDILSDWHDFPNPKKMLQSFANKLNPWLAISSNLINNADFYNTRIANSDDPMLQREWDRVKFVLESATPFTVTSELKLDESHPTLNQRLLPFVGFVPAKAALSMTPAQARAAELMADMLPKGSRTLEQAEHSKLLSTLIRDRRVGDENFWDEQATAVAAGQLTMRDRADIQRAALLTPMQYQVKRLNVEAAMQVWDLANEEERKQLRVLIASKLFNAKTLTPEQRRQYLQALHQER